MKYIFTFFSILLSLSFTNFLLYANGKYESSYHNFLVGNQYYTLADGANIRISADKKSKVIAKLPIGTKIKILSKETNTLKINGLACYWYKIAFQYKKKSLEGYIWGGLIATQAKAAPDNKKLVFLYGIDSAKKLNKQGDYYLQLQVRVSKNNRQLGKAVFKGVGALLTHNNMEVTNNRGLNKIKSIVSINFSEDMSGGAFGDAYLFWDGKRLHHVITLNHGYDAPMMYEEKLIFPSEQGGKKNRLIFTAKGGEYNDKNQLEVRTNKRIVYKWNGKSLVKVD